MLVLDEEKQSLRFSAGGCKISAWRTVLEANGTLLDSTQGQLEVLPDEEPGFRLSFPDPGLTWTFYIQREEETGTVIIRSRLKNTSGQPVSLGKAHLLDTRKPVKIGESSKDVVCLSLPGELTPRYVRRLSDPDCPRSSKIKLQLFNRAENKAMQVGFLTFQRANTEVEHGCDPGGRITSLRAYCDFAGWELAPGQTTPTGEAGAAGHGHARADGRGGDRPVPVAC